MGSYSNYYDSSRLLHGSLMNIMGTRLDVLLIGVKKAESVQIWSAVEKEVERLDKMLNKYDPESELFAVNAYAAQQPVPVKDELWAILEDCWRYWQLTMGYFDISLKDLKCVNLQREKQTVFFQNDAVQLDLGGYAKGYALEKIRKILLAKKVSQAFLNFGNSSVLAMGSHPHGENWKVGILDPYVPEKVIGTVELNDNAMSTSGNMPQHSAHIINPHTGEYSNARRVVTIVAKNAVDAEALSTSLMIADEDVTRKILSNFQIDRNLIFNL
jgi:Membrane-associated lipoprotein involved in thiamine biosynthesis